MRIKVFTAQQLHAALALVRKEMGPEALILDRQQITDDNGNSVWHVHAALDSNPEPARPSIVQPEQAKPTATAAGAAVSDPTLVRLERLVEGLGNRESATLRQSLPSHREQEAFDHLIRLGVAASHAFDLAEPFSQKKGLHSKRLNWGKRVNPASNRNALLFSGPGGCGKSTLIAKLATHYSLKGVRVALLSSDTERMGGLDILKSYAGTLGVPFFALRKNTDVEAAIAHTQTAQLLLIDSEGWSPRRDACLKRQAPLWQALDCSRRILVLPANLDEEDGMQFLSHPQAQLMSDIAFSKLDETRSPGKIINWAITSALPMSYCSFGPEVPEQMGWLTDQALTSLLNKHEREVPA